MLAVSFFHAPQSNLAPTHVQFLPDLQLPTDQTVGLARRALANQFVQLINQSLFPPWSPCSGCMQLERLNLERNTSSQLITREISNAIFLVVIQTNNLNALGSDGIPNSAFMRLRSNQTSARFREISNFDSETDDRKTKPVPPLDLPVSKGDL